MDRSNIFQIYTRISIIECARSTPKVGNKNKIDKEAKPLLFVNVIYRKQTISS
jgi:hypothetical protein